MGIAAVIAGAGSGTRLGTQGSKALVRLAGEPLVIHAVRSMVRSGVVDDVVVVAPANDLDMFEWVLGAAGMHARVVAGGSTRQASVAASLDAVGDASHVLIHDAARPLTPVDQIRSVVDALLSGHPAVVPALALVDTIKRAGAKSTDGTEPIEETLDRSVLRAMQTPQGFVVSVIREAHARFAELARDEASAAPDDAALVEALGVPVVMVPGHDEARKITRPFDLRVAEMTLAEHTSPAEL
ncbi:MULTISPECIES: 2-C-methyl-D-erythritol 4-phosphate cytidylyltransferase [unclassified Actinobaculum]|uniref:2-C-methyl-D-erythritol 4-phosphate cytidylyltransferase n=1 Tax=unclassified Actinobaculum TaxID=2609299 RepID=UPI000D529AEC|nr:MULTISPECIES: 2-C-methyl-D-erythritol 4-phosphate cytidylyltransferase [unclassified Actinobaculum]AWE41629.1 2-C-methyl-D-erythritol 4-phosphate cytidylyltransferase [Actinobaculum sp. 313]RTE49251.1 2-C-methyl-D-erythritol 4-phosphate cytidylyltransferase [Actinobaculum sp. 352]